MPTRESVGAHVAAASRLDPGERVVRGLDPLGLRRVFIVNWTKGSEGRTTAVRRAKHTELHADTVAFVDRRRD